MVCNVNERQCRSASVNSASRRSYIYILFIVFVPVPIITYPRTLPPLRLCVPGTYTLPPLLPACLGGPCPARRPAALHLPAHKQVAGPPPTPPGVCLFSFPVGGTRWRVPAGVVGWTFPACYITPPPPHLPTPPPHHLTRYHITPAQRDCALPTPSPRPQPGTYLPCGRPAAADPFQYHSNLPGPCVPRLVIPVW